MANSKQKPVPEGVKRSPGKSKFSIPRKEAPPIDGSYLDRLFADYDRQTQELQSQGDAAPTPLVESPDPHAVADQPRPEIEEAAAVTPTTTSTVTKISEQTPAAVPVPFSRNESTVNQEAVLAPVWPEVIPKVSPPQTAPRSPRRVPVAASSVAPDGDAELLDKWKRNHRLGKGEVKVLRAMLGMCREAGGDACYVKIPQLMQAAELRERQTQLVIRNLRELGLIEKVAEYSNFDRLGTRYRVVLDAD